MRLSIRMMLKWIGKARGSTARGMRGRGVPRGEEGSELVEFALCSSLLFLFIFGLVELCLVLFALNTANEAARNTARWLSVRGAQYLSGTVAPGDITTHVQSIPGAAQMTPTVNWCSVSGSAQTCSNIASAANTAAGSLVQVQVQYQYPNVPFLAPGGLAATSTAQMVIWH